MVLDWLISNNSLSLNSCVTLKKTVSFIASCHENLIYVEALGTGSTTGHPLCVFVIYIILFRWSLDIKKNRTAKEPGNLNFNPSSLKLSIRYKLATSIFYHSQVEKRRRYIYAVCRQWQGLKKRQKVEAFQRFKGFFYKLRITRNFTNFTPCRIYTLKLLLSVSFIKFKNLATNDYKISPGTLLWNFAPFWKAGNVWEH